MGIYGPARRALRLLAIPGALIALVGAAAPVAAAPVTPVEDLGTVLVDPPAPDFVLAPPGTGDAGSGPQSLDDIAARNGATAAAVKTQMSREQFVRGYQKVWVQRSSRLVMVERVEEFKLNSGAKTHEQKAKFVDETSTKYLGAVTVPGIPDSYGEKVSDVDGYSDVAVGFAKGNLFYIVQVASKQGSPEAQALEQANKQHASAPDETLDQPVGAAAAAADANSAAYQFGRSIGGLLCLAFLVLVVIFLARLITRRKPATTTAVAPGGLQLTPDRRYWWDGAAWQDTQATIPPGVQRSPDGTQWWDGASWRPAPQAVPPPQ